MKLNKEIRKNQLRVRGKIVSENHDNQQGTRVIVQQPSVATPNIDVMAYRLEQNEIATRELKADMNTGFEGLKTQFSKFSENFVTHEQLHDHKTAIELAVSGVAADVKVLQDERQALLKRIAGAAVMVLVIMVAAFYGINQFIK